MSVRALNGVERSGLVGAYVVCHERYDGPMSVMGVNLGHGQRGGGSVPEDRGRRAVVGG